MSLEIPKIEEEILDFWNKEKIFEKSLEKESPRGDYVFYDGPPFATGLPHYGHIVASLIKDIIPRYFTMRGYHVERKWGWDCHGLPIENIIEQERKFKSKKDIIDFGVDNFNESCRSKVLMYREEWRKTIERLGRWVDMDNDYRTMDMEYMESIWWVFKQLWDNGLIYEDYKSMHICPRCETTLSQSEVAEGYRTITDQSVIVKFQIPNYKLQTNSKLQITNSKTYLLAWTTTPWTLPGNVALAVGEDIDYVKIKNQKSKIKNNDYFILAKERSEIMGDGYEVVEEFNGSELVGLKYVPLFDYFSKSDKTDRSDRSKKQLENGWHVYSDKDLDFVNTEEGTGIVHIAPAFGEDDRAFGKKYNLPFIQHVSMDGRFKDEVTDFAELEVKPKRNPKETDQKIVEYLKNKGLVFLSEEYEHSYPHCWRCETPLLNYTTSSWFVAVTKIKDTLLANARSISWMPPHVKEGRFGNWLEGARDWSISRQRFWGSVLPIWRCQMGSNFQIPNNKSQTNSKPEIPNSKRCDNIVVIGSVAELEALSGQKAEDLHKHVVDNITFPCAQCGGVMKRIPDVLDCWFESGSMPYAQLHYPFENTEQFERNFPAQFIAEGVDQTRAWFYYLHVLAGAVRGSVAFQNVVVNGIVLAEDGRKMSKRLKNYPEPEAIFERYGADAMRFYLAASPVMQAQDLRFSESEVEEVYKKVLLILNNVLVFYKMYNSCDLLDKTDMSDMSNKTDKKDDMTDKTDKADKMDVLDRWITAKLSALIQEVTAAYEKYDINRAVRPLRDFITDLSTWYIRRSRDRFKSGGESAEHAVFVLRYVLLELSKIIAPVTPFLAEHVYKEVGGEKESVHLEEWPLEVKSEKLKVKNKEYVIKKMEVVRKIVELALAKRAEVGIPVRQPLGKLQITNYRLQTLEEDYLELIKDEVNVKEVVLAKSEKQKVKSKEDDKGNVGDMYVELDMMITPELRREGAKRELTRRVNALRKKYGLTIHDRIDIVFETASHELKHVIDEYGEELKRETLTDRLDVNNAVISDRDIADNAYETHEVEVHGDKVKIKIKRT